MADKPQTTTTTTEAPSTTTTTTQANKPDHAQVKGQGLKEQSSEERLAAARQQALDNHEAEHADDAESYDSVTSRNKVSE